MIQHDIRFACQQCGHCCRRDGFVFLSLDDLHRLQDYFGLEYDTFREKYISVHQRKLILNEHPRGGCMFAHTGDGRCPIYAIRPEQCRTYPFWPAVKNDRGWFIEESKECPGISVKHHVSTD